MAIGMINRTEISRIWAGTRGDALIMLVTFLGTIFIEIAFAVLLGILLSFAHYLYRTSIPRVHQVVPDKDYKQFAYRPELATCPQLGIVDILGDFSENDLPQPDLKEQKLELALILTKLKFKYKITKRDLKEDSMNEEQSEDIKTNPLLTEDGMVVKSSRHNK